MKEDLLGPKSMIRIEAWIAKTMYETTKSAQDEEVLPEHPGDK